MGLLRTLLAISVMLVHMPVAGPKLLVGGEMAVQIFYMISGFLISFVLTNSRAYESVGSFYLNRGLRLYPIYYVVVALTLAWHLFGGGGQYFETLRLLPENAKILTGISNVTLLGQDWLFFTAVEGGELVWTSDFRITEVPIWDAFLAPQAWTLGIEISFYLIAPFVLKRKIWLFGLLAASICIRLVLFALGLGEEDPWSYRFFPAELALFLLGALSQQYLLPLYLRLSESRQALVSGLAVAIALGMVCGFPLLSVEGWFVSYPFYAVFLVLLPGLFGFQNRNRWDGWIGDLSYPIYIGHFLMIWIATDLLVTHMIDKLAYIALFVTPAAIVFAILLNLVVGWPVERLRSVVRGRRKRVILSGVESKAASAPD